MNRKYIKINKRFKSICKFISNYKNNILKSIQIFKKYTYLNKKVIFIKNLFTGNIEELFEKNIKNSNYVYDVVLSFGKSDYMTGVLNEYK
ncbi:hypothetical protein CJ672_09680 [Arcobacter cryaerophilus gv. occultus]|nr:hypothetical protein CJ672_09680 [Arcobacter cryaerophilus gv. occultus]